MLRQTMQRLVRRFGAFAADTTPCGKPMSTVHAHALLVLLARGELSQRELGDELCIDKSNVTRLAAKLLGAGHALARVNRSDGRERRLVLSARGERLAHEVDVASRARFGALLEQIPAPQRQPLLAALERLVDAVEKLGARAEGTA